MQWPVRPWNKHGLQDITMTAESEEEGDTYVIPLAGAGAGDTATMTVKRLLADKGSNECRQPVNFCTPQIDAGPVYGTEASFLKETLRAQHPCYLRVTPGRLFGQDFLPLTTAEGEIKFIAGDLRVNEVRPNAACAWHI